MPPVPTVKVAYNDSIEGLLAAPKYNSYDDLYKAENEKLKAQGYGMVKLRVQAGTAANPLKYILTCPRGGKKYTSKAQHRDASSAKLGVDCPWRAKAVKMKKFDDQWVFLVGDQPHCHAADDPIALTCHRAISEAEKGFIFSLFDQPHMKPTEIVSMAMATYPGLQITVRDIYNFKQQWKAQKRGPYTATQAWIRELQTTETHFVPRYDEECRLTALFWTHPWCIQQWKTYHELLIVDNTYKVYTSLPPFWITFRLILFFNRLISTVCLSTNQSVSQTSILRSTPALPLLFMRIKILSIGSSINRAPLPTSMKSPRPQLSLRIFAPLSRTLLIKAFPSRSN